MGNAAIYYFPRNGDMRTVDLGERLSELIREPVVAASDVRSWGGTMFRSTHYRLMRVRATLQGITDQALVRDLEGVEDHLADGGWIGLTEDTDTAWAGYVASPRIAQDGQTILSFAGNPFWADSVAPDDGDPVEVIRLNQPILRSSDVIDTTYARRLILTDGLRGDFTSPDISPILIRHRGFWPSLSAPENARGGRVIQNTRRLHYTLELDLIENLSELRAMSAAGIGKFSKETGKGGLDVKRTIAQGLEIDTNGILPGTFKRRR